MVVGVGCTIVGHWWLLCKLGQLGCHLALGFEQLLNDGVEGRVGDVGGMGTRGVC